MGLIIFLLVAMAIMFVLTKAWYTQPDFVLNGYLDRWYLIPRNKYFNVYLHCFNGSDNDRALHDHPWWSCSFLLKGELSEVLFQHSGFVEKRKIIPFFPYLRRPTHMHRMLLDTKKAWTIFVTGPRLRDWGFQFPPPNGWMNYREFLAKYPPDVKS